MNFCGKYMRKTLFKDLVRTIKKSFVIFVSIIFFTMLCVALYTSMEWTTDSIIKSVDDTMEVARLYDIRMLYNRSLSEEDLQEISKIYAVDEILGNRFGYSTFVFNENKSVQARIIEINDAINMPQNVEGRLPKTSKDVAVCKKWASDNGVKIGDKLRIVPEDSGFATLAENELIVSAFMDTIEYNELNVPGYGVSEQNQLPVGCILYVCKEAFNPSIYQNGNQVLIRCDKLREYSAFSEEYKLQIESIKNNIVAYLKKTNFSDFVITDRTYLPTVVVPANLTLSLNSVKGILVYVFLIIGLLICYGSIIRMVYEQTYLIGTKLAMGISVREIRIQYCIYTGLAISLGCIFGTFLGRLLATKLLDVSSKNYAMPFELKMGVGPLIFICIIEIVLGIIVTLLGVNSTLKIKIVDLLKGDRRIKARKRFFENSALWKKMSHFSKTVINNFLNEKKRVFETLIGIVGSTILIMVSLIMYYDVKQSFKMQYSDFFKFDSYIYYDGSDMAYEEISSLLDKMDISYANVMYTRKYIKEPDNQKCNTHIIVYDDVDSISNLVNIVPDRKSTDKKTYQGLWVSSAYQKYYGEEQTEKLCFIGENKDFDVPINGFFKYYLTYCQLFMDKEMYEEYMGGKVVNNAIMLDLSGKSQAKLLDELIKIPGYRMFIDYYKQTHNSYGTFENIINVLVIIYFLLAVVLSFMVSLSVLYMFVKEKKRELITMMIIAYSPAKVKLYIFCDTAFITVVGVILGLLLGTVVGLKSVAAFENDVVNFFHGVNIWLYIIASGLVLLIMICLSLIVQRRINSFKLADINEE